jgi:hypothetical protein
MKFLDQLKKVAAIARKITGSIGDAQTILATSLQLIALYRQIRDQWQAQNPGQPLPDDLPDDATLINLLRQDAKVLEDHATALLKKYGATPGP